MRPLRPALLAVAVALLVPAAAHATLAYDRLPSPTGYSQVWAANDDGTGKHKLANKASQPAVSPDGTQVIYESEAKPTSESLNLVPAAGGTPKVLLKHLQYGALNAGVWAPSGQLIAAVTGPEVGKQKLVVVTPAGAARTIATGYFSGMSFSPDSRSIVYGRTAKASDGGYGGDVWVAPVDGGAPVNLTKDGRSVSPLWGPKAIVFSRVTKSKHKGDAPKLNLDLIQPDGTGRTKLTNLKVPFLLAGLTAVAWSGDGSRLVAAYGGQDFDETYTVNPATGKTKRISDKKGLTAWGLSADGARILGATGGYEPGGPGHNIVTVPYGGGKRTVLVKNAFAPSWSAGLPVR